LASPRSAPKRGETPRNQAVSAPRGKVGCGSETTRRPTRNAHTDQTNGWPAHKGSWAGAPEFPLPQEREVRTPQVAPTTTIRVRNTRWWKWPPPRHPRPDPAAGKQVAHSPVTMVKKHLVPTSPTRKQIMHRHHALHASLTSPTFLRAKSRKMTPEFAL
jgi:hypothetical protein